MLTPASHQRLRIKSSDRNQKGVSLLESLVSLVVLALGVLGLLGVQLRTMVDNQNATYALSAARLADELFERIKLNANADLALNTNFDPNNPLAVAQWNWLNNYAVNWGVTPVIANNCDTGFCDPGPKAAWDLNRWKTSVQRGLPNGDGQVLRSPDNPRQLIAIVGWRANEGTTPPPMLTIPGVTLPTACGTTHSCYFAYGQP